MKKILLLLILSFVCLFSVVACGNDNEKTGDENTPVVELSKELRDARSYLIQLYGDGSETATAADYYCVSQVPSGDKKLPITWSVNTDKVTVSVVPEGEENAGMTLVDVTIGAEAIQYVLSAKIVGSDNSELKMDFKRVVPAAKAATIAEFIAAKDEEAYAALTGVITAVTKVGTSGSFILTDETGSIFCYDGLDVALGDKVTVIGQLSLYNDVFPQLAKPALAATISKDNDVKAASGTPLAVTASEIKADLSGNLTEKYAGKYLEITGYVMKNSQGYINLKATLEDTDACVNLYKNDSIALNEDLVNQQVKIYGFMRGSSSSYITIQVQGFEVVKEDLTDEQIIDRALSSITLPEAFKTAGSAALAASLGDVTFTWEILGEATTSLVISEGKLVATLGEEEVTRTVKLTATLGETTKTKEFTVTVAKKTGVEQHVVTTAPVAGVAYKLGLVHGNLENKTFFITGAMDGFYYATTEVNVDGCDVYVEVVDGGYHMYTLNGEAKVYLNIVASGTHINVTYDNTAISVWTYNEEINTMVTPVDGVDYFLGTRSDKSYKTFSPCKLEYATTSFIAHFYQVGVPTYAAHASAPAAGSVYKLALVHGNLENKTFFITGAMDGFYYATTEVSDDACDIYVEVVDGGYHIYTLNGEAKVYLNIVASGTHINVTYDDTAISVWTYNEEINTMVTPVDGVDYFLGTRSDKSYKTFSPCKLEYAATSFIAHFYSLQYVAPETEEPTPTPTPDPEPTPTPDPEQGGIVVNPEADKEYYLSFTQTVKNAEYYFIGTMDRYYGATSTDITAAVKVVLVAANGGYHLKFQLNGATKYINTEVSGTHLNFVIGDTAISVWSWNAEYNTLTTTCGTETVFMGTYDNYTTFGLCKLSYATSNYVAHLSEGNIGSVTPEPTPDPEPTPEPDGDIVDTSNGLSIEAYASANNWANSTGYSTITYDENTTITATGTSVGSYALNTGKYYTNGQNWRIYQSEQATVTITSTKTIASVVVEYAIKNTGILTVGTTNYASGSVIAVNGNSLTFTVGQTGSATNGQIQITKITVVYAD